MQEYKPIDENELMSDAPTQLKKNEEAIISNFSGAEEPGTKMQGQFYFNTSTNKLEFYNGSKFVAEIPCSITGTAARAKADESGRVIADNYLLNTSASNTYLTKTDASDTYLTKTDASDTYAETRARIANTYEPANGDYIGMRIEGGGTIFFDYALGYKYGSLSVAPVTTNLHSYHVDKDRNIVVCDDPDDSSKKARFYVVSDYDIGDYKHGNNLMWADTGASHMYNVLVGTSTAFSTGYANTEKCIAAANTDNRLEWNSNAYNCIWHYIWKGDWNARNPKWFVPSKDELNVLLNMQWQESDRRKSYDGKTTFKQLPINFYSYYWSSSESSATVAHNADFYGGNMYANGKNVTISIHVRLVKTF